MRPTSIYSLSAELGANTIDPYELNCRVRNGNGCDLVGINISLIKASMLKEQIWKGTVLQQFLLRWNPARRFLDGSSLPFNAR